MSLGEPASARDIAQPVNIEALGDSDWTVRRNAVSGLSSETGWDTVNHLLTVLRDQHRDLSRLNSAIQVLTRTPADVVPELIRLLSHVDHEVRTYAALALGERGDVRAIEPLMTALTDGNANVQTHAIEALGKLRAGAAVDALVELVERRDFELAFPALDALLAIGDGRVIDDLIPLLQDSLYKVAAVDALGEMGDRAVIKPLIDLLADPEVPPENVARSLSRLHDRYVERLGDEKTVPQAVRTATSPASIQALISTVSRIRSNESSDTATVLSWLPGPEIDEALARLIDRPPINNDVEMALVRRGSAIVPRLINRLATSGPEGRKAVIGILARIGDRSSVPALLQLLAEGDDAEASRQTLEALTAIGDATAYAAARSFLGHSDVRVRQAAVAAVNCFGHAHTAVDLLGDFRNPSPLVRESAVKVAAYLGLPECFESVLACCEDSSERVRRTAIEHLPSIDDPRVWGRLLEAIHSEVPSVRVAAATALSKIDDQSAAERLLTHCLRDEDVWVRYFAIRSLVAIDRLAGVRQTLAHLARTDPAMQVQVAAVEALGRCGPESFSLLDELARLPGTDLSYAALESIGSIEHPGRLEILQDALQSDDVETRIRAIRGLARAQGHSAIELLLAVAAGREERTSDEAIRALASFPAYETARALIAVARIPARRDRCVADLASMAGAAVPALVYGLRHGDLDTKRAVVEALTRIRTPEAIDVLESALADPTPAVRFAAISSLAHIRHT